jgi:hypothetical protein
MTRMRPVKLLRAEKTAADGRWGIVMLFVCFSRMIDTHVRLKQLISVPAKHDSFRLMKGGAGTSGKVVDKPESPSREMSHLLQPMRLNSHL